MGNTTWDNDNKETLAALTVTGTSTLSVVAISSSATLANGANVATGTVSGSTFAATTAQKLGFWGATPIVQPASANQAVVAALTDSSGGTSGGNTIAAVTDAASAADGIATLAAKVNALNTLVTALRLAALNSGLIKGAA